ncbi:hypothetical protein JYU13_00460 [Gammaproteobacteria bacterium AH-315-M22]|nr:hypothetical protein [Gammaproteobacteria bacterium AH-315-M22]
MINTSSIEALRARFSTDEWPEFLALQQNDLAITIHLSIPKSLQWFSGHFPENPILPGVVQTHWACELSKLLFAVTTPFEKITRLRFKTIVLPDAKLTLLLENKLDLKHVAFLYTCNEAVISSGNVKFKEAT